MYKVLIVDDEPFVREGLKSLLKWEDFGYQICGEARNGEEALESILRHKPHLVITDIKMPAIDGLELIRRVTEELEMDLKFVVLSGYADFQYAQTAMKYNVNKYILKPIDKDELTGVLGDIKKEIEDEVKLREKVLIGEKALTNEIIRKLINGENTGTVLQLAKQYLSIDKGQEIRYIMLELDNFEQWFNEMDDDEIDRRINAVYETLTACIGKDNSSCIHEERINRYGILINLSILNNYGQDIKLLVDNLYNAVLCKYAPISIYVGKTVYDPFDLKESYESCLQAKSRNFFNENSEMVFYDEVKDLAFCYNFRDIGDFTGLLERIEHKDTEGIQKRVEELFCKFTEDMTAPEIVKAYIINFGFEIVKIINKMNGDSEKLAEYFKKLNTPRTSLDKLMDIFLHLCIDSSRYLEVLREKQSSGILFQIERYILKNYAKNLKLKNVAAEFFVNPVYLGQQFKKKYGMYFNDYLHNLRVEEAKKLLRRTELKVYEIANKVGYNDTDYFARKFEKFTNMTPTEYKKTWNAGD